MEARGVAPVMSRIREMNHRLGAVCWLLILGLNATVVLGVAVACPRTKTRQYLSNRNSSSTDRRSYLENRKTDARWRSPA